MRFFKRCLGLVLVLFMILPVFISGAAVIERYEDPNDYGFAEMYVDNNRIVWADTDFEYMYKRLPTYEYHSCDSTLSGLHGRYSISMKDAHTVDITDVVYSGNSLTFDYTATIDLAPDEEGRTTYHGLFVLFYEVVDDAKKYYGKYDTFYDIVDGYQIVKYVAPGTVGGQKILESGEDITVMLPDNFDPAKHIVGYAVWRIEDKDVEYKYEYPEMEEFPYIADPSTDSSQMKLFDLSGYIDTPYFGFYGYENAPLEYPITSRLLGWLDDYYYWYRYGAYDLYKTDRLGYCSSLWAFHYYVNDPETIPQVYLDEFERRLEDEERLLTFKSPIDSSLDALRINGHSWDKDVLTVNWSGDFLVEYYSYEDEWTGEEKYGVSSNLGGEELTLALRNKSDGKLAFLARTCETVKHKPLYGAAGKENVGKVYTYTETGSSEIKMPETFDPELHDIEIYFTRYFGEGDGVTLYALQIGYIEPAYPISSEGYSKPDPIPEPEPEPEPDPIPEPEPEILLGDANGDGTVNLTDAALLMKYIAKWDVEIDLEAANMNGDGGINSVDVSRIMKRVAGWDESWWKG